jgi:hypothetical protein
VQNRATGSTLYRAPLAGAAPVVMQHVDTEESIRDVAVSPDDQTVWFTHSYPGDSPEHLERLRGGVVTQVGDGVISVAISPSGARLVYSSFVFGKGVTASPTLSRLVVVDLASGEERTFAVEGDASPPSGIDHLAWSPDGRLVLFALTWEGSEMHVLDPATASSASDVVTPVAPIPGRTESRAVQQACWTSPTKLAVGTWYSPSGEVAAPLPRGDVVGYDVRSKKLSPAGVSVFGQAGIGAGNGMACRDDGAVALVDSAAWDPMTSGDLKVIRADGTTTRLGRDYLTVVQV